MDENIAAQITPSSRAVSMKAQAEARKLLAGHAAEVAEQQERENAAISKRREPTTSVSAPR